LTTTVCVQSLVVVGVLNTVFVKVSAAHHQSPLTRRPIVKQRIRSSRSELLSGTNFESESTAISKMKLFSRRQHLVR
jgi:hypothetical protein